MKELLTTHVGRLRLVSVLEALSYVLLLGVAMPLKYLAHMPALSYAMGRIHGGLFVLFVLALGRTALEHAWPARRTLVAFVSSVVPLGGFWFAHALRDEPSVRS